MKIKTQEYHIEEYIPVGSKNAINREYLSKKTGMNDRTIRMLIAESDAPIINLGYGYFIPDMNDSTDRHEAMIYCHQEMNRIRSLQEKVSNKFGELIMEIETNQDEMTLEM